jgi:hypothetical protein
MEADVILHQFRHEAIGSAADGNHELHDIDTLSISFQRPLDGFNLAAEPATRLRSFAFCRTVWLTPALPKKVPHNRIPPISACNSYVERRNPL